MAASGRERRPQSVAKDGTDLDLGFLRSSPTFMNLKGTSPCPLCGYDALAPPCPHCGGHPREGTLRRRPADPLLGTLDGLLALPFGLWFLATTRGVKRWLVPPLVATLILMIGALVVTFRFMNGLLESHLPGEFTLTDTSWDWLENRSETWDWAKATWGAVLVALQWVVNAAWGLLTSKPLQLIGWFFVGSLVMWYCFSIAYEALAGPFLDEVQARLEAKWFGSDPRSRLERPTDIPPETCARLTTLGLGLVSGIFVLALVAFHAGFWLALLLAPLGLVPSLLLDRRYGTWLAWVATVEGRATWTSLQASLITGVLLVFALPLYFVPGVGYFLFAAAAGFATAISLLDIPLERRGWPLRCRLRFIARNMLPMLAFGITSGMLLAVPFLGPVLMVPAASVGGLWLICRLDKNPLRSEGERWPD